MRIIRHLQRTRPRVVSPVVTLGNFDGVHAGHQAIVARVVDAAADRGGEPVAITFFPHPARVLAPARAPAPITSLRERLEALGGLGIGTIVAQHFTRAFSRLAPEEFVERYLVEALGAVHVVIGHNVSFGRDRAGNAELLRRAGERYGFTVEIVGPVRVDGIEVSSTEVRTRLAAGDVAGATRLLGRSYSIVGRVTVGKRRGRALGFPTANVRPRVPPIVPDGVYAVLVEHEGERFGGVANIGRNPTFGEGAPRTVEAHLFDFDGDLYGERLRVALVARIRGEVRFASPEALVEQIAADARQAREILG
ncbi:MAG: riboflavin kinase / adenylyltransferase [Candidatus Binatota bacterium]|nr:riboflavin kinase / adenylyltransferase [Candidatus Binatota bacterium]